MIPNPIWLYSVFQTGLATRPIATVTTPREAWRLAYRQARVGLTWRQGEVAASPEEGREVLFFAELSTGNPHTRRIVIPMPRPDPMYCPVCSGTGDLPPLDRSLPRRDCWQCAGSGRWYSRRQRKAVHLTLCEGGGIWSWSACGGPVGPLITTSRKRVTCPACLRGPWQCVECGRGMPAQPEATQGAPFVCDSCCEAIAMGCL